MVFRFGTFTTALPVLGTFRAKVIGKVCPASSEKKISTLGEFTGAVSVPATSHVIVSVVPVSQKLVPDCEVTTKGPELPSTVTLILSLAEAPPPTKLSRTVYLKFITLLTEGITSHLLDVPGPPMFPVRT